MKKTLSTIMILAMMSQTAFSAANQNPASIHNVMIAKAFDIFRYQMTVDVNPNDPNDQSKVVARFKERMTELQDEGVTALEIMDYTRKTMMDDASRAEFDRLLETMDLKNISNEQAANMAMQFMAGKYQQGASYGGGARSSLKTAAVILGIVATGVATYFLAKYIKDRLNNDPSNDPNNSTTTVTTTETNTETETSTDTQTNTMTETLTETITETNTDSDPIGMCCNAVTGKIVSASFTGCMNGDALVWVSSEDQCTKLGSSNGWDD